MHYFSTNRLSPVATFREATLLGQPDDKGLYFPESIPTLRDDYVDRLATFSNEQIAFDVIRPFVDGSIVDEALFEICSETVSFEFPLVEISPSISSLELFHGPTLAFKDVGARFMSRCLRHFSNDVSKKTVVIVATSGDTGGAVANGFHNINGVEVVILYPKGKVSRVQELQLSTLGGNVAAVEVDGTFDDCQALAKCAFADSDLRGKGVLTSANSINIARWLPQQFYYFFALKQWIGDPPIISVPSGNFGNLAAGLLAWKAGLLITEFIAACNANDVVPNYLVTGEYKPKASISTLSNAMDVGDPSNFVRILEIFTSNFASLKDEIEAVSVSDDETAETIRNVYGKYGYILDPHGAVGYKALADRLAADPNAKGIFLETAHPIKFDSVAAILGQQVEPPPAVKALESKSAHKIEIRNDYDSVRSIVLQHI